MSGQGWTWTVDWWPAEPLPELAREHVIENLENCRPEHLGVRLIPLCLLAFLQEKDERVAASALCCAQVPDGNSLRHNMILFMNRAGVLEVTSNAQAAAGGAGEDDGVRGLTVRIADETLKDMIVEWTFTTMSQPGAALANAVFRLAVTKMREAPDPHGSHPFPTYSNLVRLMAVWKVLKRLENGHIARHLDLLDRPRFFDPDITVTFGKLLLDTAAQVIAGGFLKEHADRLVEFVRREMLVTMAEAAETARSKVQSGLLPDEQLYAQAAEALSEAEGRLRQDLLERRLL